MSSEESIQPAETQLLDALFQSLPGLAWLLDETGRFVRWNRGYQNLVGLSDEEMSQLYAIDIVVPRHYSRVLVAMRDVLAGHEVTFGCSLKVGDGEIPIHGSGALMKVGNRAFIFGAASDISAQLAAEAALTQSNLKYQVVFNATHDAIVVHGEDGRILDVNDQWCSMFGCKREDAIDTNANHLAFLEPPYSRVEAHEKVRLAAQVGPQVFEWPCTRINGELFWTEVALRAATIAEQKCVIAAVRDISERKRNEAERHRLEESLRHAQKMGSIGRLAGGIAHDFNNLLTAISGNLSLAMLGEGGKAATEDMLFEAARAAESAANLTRQLLTFSRKQVIHPKILDLNDTVKGLQKMLRRLLGEDVELCVSLGSDLGRVESDEGQIEQVLVNLAVNARDAMPNGGKLVIETANVTAGKSHSGQSGPLQPGRYVALQVSDSGTGMSPEVKEHLFEPFFTTKEVGKGTGLGLAMVYGAVQQNRGHVVVDSELGQGTSVHIYLPRVDEPRKHPGDNTRPELAGGVESIVVVEDEEQVRTLAVRILARQGYRVHAYGNAEDALVALSRMEQPFDLLLTDVIMPGMNGRELAQRAQQLRPGLRVLFTSGYTDDVIAQHGVLEECVDFIPKPYSLESLTRRIREILDRAKATPSQ